jgi:hypothetical protein
MTFKLNSLNNFKALVIIVCCLLVLVLINNLVKKNKKEPFYQVNPDGKLYTRTDTVLPPAVPTESCNVAPDGAISTLGSLCRKAGETTLFIPNTLESIAAKAFEGQISIKEVYFEPGGTNPLVIGALAFAGTSIESVHIPARVTSIGSEAFKGIKKVTFEANSNLQSIELDSFGTVLVTISNLDIIKQTDYQAYYQGDVQYTAFELSKQAIKHHGGSNDHIIVFYDDINDGRENAFAYICGEDNEVEWTEV